MAAGSRTERGTLGIAAWWKTTSAPSATARGRRSKSARSPSSHSYVARAVGRGSRGGRSRGCRPRGRGRRAARRASTRCEPMNPAPPVTRQRRLANSLVLSVPPAGAPRGGSARRACGAQPPGWGRAARTVAPGLSRRDAPVWLHHAILRRILYADSPIERGGPPRRVSSSRTEERAMCGIAGVLRLDGATADPGALRALVDPLAHRGPDSRGSPRRALGFGMRRLSIIDSRRRSAHLQRGRPVGRLQRRDLQLPRAARRAAQRGGTAFYDRLRHRGDRPALRESTAPTA